MNAKRIVWALALAMVLFVISSLNAPQAAAAGSPPTKVQVVANVLNVRSGPGQGYPVLAKLYLGDYATPLGVNSGWVCLSTNNGVQGWSFGTYLQPIDGSLDNLPLMGANACGSSVGGPSVPATCQRDKISTWSPLDGSGLYTVEVGGHHVQHIDAWVPGLQSISFISRPILPPEVPVYWKMFGSIWEDTQNCGNHIEDARFYSLARLDTGHSGLVIDMRQMRFDVVVNIKGWKQSEIDLMVQMITGGRIP